MAENSSSSTSTARWQTSRTRPSHSQETQKLECIQRRDGQDQAIHFMVRLCNILHADGLRIVLCSGRNEKNRPETVEWLEKQGVRYHELLLRKDEDFRTDAIVKSEILKGLNKEKILFVVEDRSRVVEMWRSEGLVCLQCAPGEF
jgi:hypothetical protein